MNVLKRLWPKVGVALNEPSTWRGLIMILTALGLGLTHEQQEAIVIAGLAVSGALGLFIKDNKRDPTLIKEAKQPLDDSDLQSVVNKGRS